MFKRTMQKIIGLSLLAAATLTGAFCTLSVKADTESGLKGRGLPTDPYIVATEADLMTLSNAVARGESFLNKYVLQTNDIQMKDFFLPIGNPDLGTGFEGEYDGSGHTISNLRIDTRYNTVNNALFGSLGGTVKNLGVESGKIEGANCATFAATGMPGKLPLIYNCYTLASVEGLGRNASFVDNYNGTVQHCWAYNETELPLVGYSCMKLIDSYSNGDLFLSQANSQEVSQNGALSEVMLTNEGFLETLNKPSIEQSMLHGITPYGWKRGETHPIFSRDFYSFKGDGSKTSPYELNTPEDLAFFSAKVNGGESYKGQYFRLTNDIDLSCYENFIAIGIYDSGATFAGTLDGNGHTISNMKMIHPALGRVDNNALFGYLSGTVINLTVQDSEIHGSCVASFAVSGSGDSRIVNCSARNNQLCGVTRNGAFADNYAGKIAGCYYEGEDALVGYNATTIAFCTSTGDRVSDNYATVNAGNKINYHGSIDSAMNARLLYAALRISFNPSLLNFWEGGVPSGGRYSLQGAGSKESPILIRNASDLVFFAASVNGGEPYKSLIVHQTADIDMNGIFFMPIGLSGGIARFMGTYDGCGHTLSNLVIHENELAYNNALFGSLEGRLLNLGIESGLIYGTYAAGLVCESYVSMIRNCYSKATVYGFIRSGGIADNFDGDITNTWYNNEQNHPFVSHSFKQLYACYTSGPLIADDMDITHAIDSQPYHDFTLVGPEFAEFYNEKMLTGASQFAYSRISLNLWAYSPETKGMVLTQDRYSLSPDMLIRFRSVIMTIYKWNIIGTGAILFAVILIILAFILEGKPLPIPRKLRKHEGKDQKTTS